MTRKALSKKIRFEVFKRDAFTCQYCGKTPPKVVLEIDHIHPVSEGGDNDIDNLLSACFDCNRGKGAGLLTTIPAAVNEKAGVIAERMEQLKAFEELKKAKKRYENRQIKAVEKIFSECFEDYHFSKNFKESVRKFLKELPPSEVRESMDIACARMVEPERAIKYFCGICWQKIKGDNNA